MTCRCETWLGLHLYLQVSGYHGVCKEANGVRRNCMQGESTSQLESDLAASETSGRLTVAENGTPDAQQS